MTTATQGKITVPVCITEKHLVASDKRIT